jgi:hypothetical protein
LRVRVPPGSHEKGCKRKQPFIIFIIEKFDDRRDEKFIPTRGALSGAKDKRRNAFVFMA